MMTQFWNLIFIHSKDVTCKALFIGPPNCELLKHGSTGVVAELLTLCCISNSNVSEISDHVAEGCVGAGIGSH